LWHVCEIRNRRGVRCRELLWCQNSGFVWHFRCENRTVYCCRDGSKSWTGAEGYGMWVRDGGWSGQVCRGGRKGLMAFFSEVVKNCLEDFVVGDGMLVI
jgi:hypothetical protein